MSRHCRWAIAPPGRERRALLRLLYQGRGLIARSPREDNDAQLFAQTRTLRIRQSHSLNFSNEGSTLAALSRLPILTLKQFSISLRGPQALRTVTIP